MEIYSSIHLSPSTQKSDKVLFYKWIIPRIGARIFEEIEKSDIIKFRADLMKETSYYNANLVITKISKLYNWAINEMGMKIINPSIKIRPLPWDTEKGIVLKLNEISDLLNVLDGWEKVLITIYIYSGARLGEGLGFQWSDVDFETRMISFNRQIKQEGIRNKLKNDPSKKTINMLPELIETLFEWKTHCREDAIWIIEDEGNYLKYDKWCKIFRRNIIKLYNFPEGFTTHDFKHTYTTTIMKKYNIMGSEKQFMCRSATPDITENIYTQVDTDILQLHIDSIKRKD